MKPKTNRIKTSKVKVKSANQAYKKQKYFVIEVKIKPKTNKN